MFIWLPLSAQADKALEKKAGELQQEVRCPVCLGQSISDSDTEESEALRMYIQDQLNQSIHQMKSLHF